MRNTAFKNKTPNFKNLINYGFRKNNNDYYFIKDIMNGEFVLNININKSGEIKTELKEKATNEIYTLHLIEGTKGSFIGKIREEYQTILDDISKKCFKIDIFKNKQTKEVIAYVKGKYNNDPEYLWEKFPDNAICRRQDNKKWYLAILTVKKAKLGIESDEYTEVIDIRVNSEKISKMIERKNIYPGYHMNKKHWISIILDNSMQNEELYKLIDESYKLAKK